MPFNNGIDMNEYNLIPDLNNSPELGVFTDELKPLIVDALNLPYGCLSVIVYGIQDILTGEEEIIPEYIRPAMIKAYYLLSGALLTKSNVTELEMSKEDLLQMNLILKDMVGLITLIDKYYRGEIEVELIDGEWHIKSGDKLLLEAEKNVESFFGCI